MSTLPFVPRAAVPTHLQPQVALDQDGVFTRAQARAEGWTDGRQSRLIARGLWVPITPFVLRSSPVEDGPWPRARAVSLSGGRVVSHHTAAGLWGLAVPPELHCIREAGRPIRGIHHHRLVLPDEDLVHVWGIPVTTPSRTVADLLCWLPVEGSIGWVTDALRRSLMSVAGLQEAAAAVGGRHGAGRARFVADSCVGMPFSVLEWRYQQLAVGVASGWLFNTVLRDQHVVIGCVDSLHVETRTVVELDGKRFHGPERFQADRTRDQRLAAAGYLVLRFTWADLEQRPAYVAEVIRRTISARARRAELT